MSADDVLDRATRALREGTDGLSGDARLTRARVMAVATGSRKRRRLAVTLVPLAAVLAVSTAWADTHGWLAVVRVRLESSFGLVSPPQPSRPAEVRRSAGGAAPARGPEPTPAPPEAEVPLVTVDSLPRSSDPTSAPTARASATASPALAPPPAPPAQDQASLLYAAAHRAHFVDHDPAAALRAWDAYLLAAPDGSFAPEARYNRAITLIRLARHEEARRALTPFAEGAYGTYRAREARELLDALREE